VTALNTAVPKIAGSEIVDIAKGSGCGMSGFS
jgi:hypothetical protein